MKRFQNINSYNYNYLYDDQTDVQGLSKVWMNPDKF